MDSGANISIMSTKFARLVVDEADLLRDKALKIRGLAAQKVLANVRAEVKVTLGWKVAYLFEIWIGSETGGCDIILGTDFMMSAGVMLDLHRGRLCLPEEVVIPLTHKTALDDSSPRRQSEVRMSEATSLNHRDKSFLKIRSDRRSEGLVLWVSDYRGVYPTVMESRRGKINGIELTNVSGGFRHLAQNSCVALWISSEHLPTLEGFVRIKSSKYEEWQVLIYEHSTSAGFEVKAQRERDLMEIENEMQLNKNRRNYLTPPEVMRRPQSECFAGEGCNDVS